MNRLEALYTELDKGMDKFYTELDTHKISLSGIGQQIKTVFSRIVQIEQKDNKK